jgi:hypothetical protein
MTAPVIVNNDGAYIVIDVDRYIDGVQHWYRVKMWSRELVALYGDKALKNKSQKVKEAHGAVVVEYLGV